MAVAREQLCGHISLTTENAKWKRRFLCESCRSLYNVDQMSLRESLQPAVIRVGGWSETAISLEGREPGVGKSPPVSSLRTAVMRS
jgi:hypothetical protein